MCSVILNGSACVVTFDGCTESPPTCLSIQDYIGADIPLLSCGGALVLISFRQSFIHSTHCFISFTLPGRESGKELGRRRDSKGQKRVGVCDHLHAP